MNYHLALLSKQAGIKHFSLVSAKGANSKVYANNHLFFHSLLYLKIKGELENKIIELKFPRFTIFRPGLLNRHMNDARMLEEFSLKMLKAIDVKDLANAMFRDSLLYIEGIAANRSSRRRY